MSESSEGITAQQISEQQQRLRDEVEDLRKLVWEAGGPRARQRIDDAVEAYAALTSLARALELRSGGSHDTPISRPEAWHAALAAFVERQKGAAIQADVDRIAATCRQEVDRLQTEDLAPLRGRVESLRTGLEGAEGALRGRLEAAETALAEANHRMAAVEDGQRSLLGLVESLRKSADDLREACSGDGGRCG